MGKHVQEYRTLTVLSLFQYPVAADFVNSDFYVDNVLTGASTIEEAVNIRIQLTNFLGKLR